jgi:hypothetical protein
MIQPWSNRVAGRVAPSSSHTIHLRWSYGGTGLTSGSAYGGSWQSLPTEQHSLSATVIAARSSASRLHRSVKYKDDMEWSGWEEFCSVTLHVIFTAG